MKFCKVLPIDKVDKTTLMVRTTPRGDQILTGMLQGVEGETTVAIKFSDKISPESAEKVCNSFSGELFDQVVQGFGDDIKTADISVEEFEQLCGVEIVEEVSLSEELALSGTVYTATLLQAGESLSFGENGKPTTFSAEVLKDAVERKVFEGIPVRAYRTGNFFTHLQQVNPKLAAQFPEGLPDALIGKIQNAVWDESKQAIVGKVVLENSKQASLMDRVLQKAQSILGSLSSFMGLSVVIDVLRKSGQIAKILQSEGIDVVSVPAGGGHFETVLNGLSFGEPNNSKEAVKMEKLIQYIMSLDASVGDLTGKTEDELVTILQGIMAKKATAIEEAKKNATSAFTPEIDGLKQGYTALEANMQKMLDGLNHDRLQLAAEAKINASSLPTASKSKLILGLGNVNDISDAAITTMLKNEADYLDSLKGDGFVNLASNLTVGEDHWEKIQEAFAAGLDIKDAKREFGVLSLQQFYKEGTGDWGLRNKIDVKKVGMGVMSTADFANALANVLYRRLSQAFIEQSYGEDVLITDYRVATDFKNMQTSNTGGFATMPVVGELEPYTEVTVPTDWKSTYAVKKYGQLMPVSWESILNDDIGLMRRLIDKFGAAMRRTYAAHVYTLMTSNPAVPDSGDTLFHSNHANTGTTAFSLAELDVVKLAMYAQTEPGSAVKLGFRPYHIFISSHLETEVKKANRAQYLDSSFTPNVYQFAFGNNDERIHVVPFWTDDHDWYIMGNPAQCPFIEMAHLNGNKTPELFLQDQPTVDSVFTSEKITYKIRFVFQGKVIEYRNVYRESVT